MFDFPLRQTLLMRTALPVAIVLAAALIAASIAVTNRWAISNAAPYGGAYRLDMDGTDNVVQSHRNADT